MWIKIAKACFWLLVGLIFFAHLDHLPVMIFDEGRLAVSAYEMYKHGHFLVPHYDGGPDMWSVKPPFMIWCQVLFINLIGYGITAIRLPSAFAGFATALILFQFLRKNIDSQLIRYFAVAVLVTTPGYIMVHGTRTGDYDSLFIMFNTFYCFQFYNYLKHRKDCYLLYVLAGILLAVMTKGVAGLVCAPFLLIMAIKSKAVLQILKSSSFYFGFFILVLTVFGYYFYRNSINPGYWNAVVYEELGGRFSGAIQEDKQPWYYYLRMIFFDHYYFWFPFAIMGIVLWFFETREKLKKVLSYNIMAALYFLLIISITGTKLEWYEMPMYPFLAVVVAVAIYHIYILVEKLMEKKVIKISKYLPYMFLVVLFFYSFRTVKDSVFFPSPRPFEIDWFNISFFLRDQYENLDDPDKYILVNEGYNSHLLFYKYYHREKGRNFSIDIKEDVKVGDFIILHEFDVLEYIADKFEAKELGRYKNVKLIEIISLK